MERRNFIKSTAALSALSLVTPELAFARDTMPIGLQLYTVRDLMASDPAGTLKQIADLGYQVVEGAGYDKRSVFGVKSDEFRRMLDDNGLKMVSMHTVSPYLKNSLEETLEDAKKLGNSYLILAWLFPEERTSIDDYKKVIDLLITSSEAAKSYGIQLGYHNHEFEFISLDDQVPYDLMMKELPGDMPMELDLYWVAKAGLSADDLFARYPGRFPLWHVKDMDNTPEKGFTEVGNGVIDFQSIFNEAKLADLKYFFVEQDQTPGSPLDSIKTSIKNVKKIIE